MSTARRVAALAVIMFLPVPLLRAQPATAPVESIPNWTAPPFWTPEKPEGRRSVVAAGEDSGVQPQGAEGLPTSALAFTAITPCRIADTRDGSFPAGYGPPSLTAGAPRSFVLTSRCGIPGVAEAVSLNITVTNTQGPGFILIYPQGGAQPNVSTLNYVSGQTVANAAVVPLGAGGGVTVVAGVSGTDLIIDTNGYYAPQPVVTSINGLFGALTLAAGANISITPAGQTITIGAPNVNATFLGGQPASFFQTIAAPAPAGTVSTRLDVFGYDTSATIGTDGLGLIAYYDGANLDLKVGHCSDIACTSATLTPLDTVGNVGTYPGIIIGADGLGLISYYDDTNDDLKVAHCSNVLCTSATVTTLDGAGGAGSVGAYSSVTIGADGLGLISYYDADGANLKVAHCSNVTCTSATFTALDSAGSVGLYTSITTGADGLGLISYYGNGDLKVAHCSNTPCTAATVTPLDTNGNAGAYSSVTIGADGLGLISYLEGGLVDLRVAHCSNVLCTSATITTIETGTSVGSFTSITIGADGLGLISYHDNSLGVAHCSNVLCTSQTIATVDNQGSTGLYNSVTIGSDGLPLISYRSTQFNDVRVAHCSNTLCAPFFRRR
jgi:hypothetical protein